MSQPRHPAGRGGCLRARAAHFKALPELGSERRRRGSMGEKIEHQRESSSPKREPPGGSRTDPLSAPTSEAASLPPGGLLRLLGALALFLPLTHSPPPHPTRSHPAAPR